MMSNWLVVEPPEKSWSSSVGAYYSQLFMESHSKFHGCSSHHQAVVIFFPRKTFVIYPLVICYIAMVFSMALIEIDGFTVLKKCGSFHGKLLVSHNQMQTS
jgi:hypothetical protein